MNQTVKRVFPVALAFLLIVNSSFATDGYFLTGYGTKQQGQGGAGVAKPGDSLAGATNPAGLFLVGFGTAYAGGCTSGHAISGLANFELPSLVAVVGFFSGGLAATCFILPFVIGRL
jgi:uncharacterized membrane protein YedE/YeeE